MVTESQLEKRDEQATAGSPLPPYVGSGDYCFSHSLHMSLLGSGAPPESLPTTGFIECLTTMPFGHTYLKDAELFFFSGPSPELGLTRAIETLGWECRLERGGSEGEALARLRAAAQHGPVLLGPVDMGYLTYNPNYPYLDGADHYVLVLTVAEDHVVVHDPKGFPCAALPVENLLRAWRAEKIGYVDEPYTQRASFRTVAVRSRPAMIEQTMPFIAANLRRDLWDPGVYGGVPALRMLAHTLRAESPESLATHLLYFALPLGLRHKVDAQTFLMEGGRHEAAGLIARQARLLGQAQYAGVQRAWSSAADLIEQAATIEEDVIAVSESW
ncbi:MAG: hypothetical protein JOZ41_18110 [Chloroflexi bacterium]|nr:hypothetical protein [Chloroflexota bacterium]